MMKIRYLQRKSTRTQKLVIGNLVSMLVISLWHARVHRSLWGPRNLVSVSEDSFGSWLPVKLNQYSQILRRQSEGPATWWWRRRCWKNDSGAHSSWHFPPFTTHLFKHWIFQDCDWQFHRFHSKHFRLKLSQSKILVYSNGCIDFFEESILWTMRTAHSTFGTS